MLGCGWEEEETSLISGSQSNCFPLFLIYAEDPTGYHINKMVATLRRGVPKRREGSSHLHTLQGAERPQYGRALSFKAQGREELAMGRRVLVTIRKNSPIWSCGAVAKQSPPRALWPRKSPRGEITQPKHPDSEGP